MNPKFWTKHKGVAVNISRADIDTDQILPKQFMKKVERTGFGKHLFHDWRYLDADGNILNSEFVLNQEPFRNSSILIAGENFGCGSSREHAPWALADFGFRVVIAPSFADIFSLNSPKNGIALVKLTSKKISEIIEWLATKPGAEISVDLQTLTIEAVGKIFHFTLDRNSVDRIRNGWDDIDLTLSDQKRILAFQERRFTEHPFLLPLW